MRIDGVKRKLGRGRSTAQSAGSVRTSEGYPKVRLGCPEMAPATRGTAALSDQRAQREAS